MQEIIKYLETGSNDPAYNLAFEQYVLEHRRDATYLMLWQNDNTIVIGQNQNAEAEINQAFVKEHGIHVVRRMTGGGAVYHDLGNLNYSFITDSGDASKLTMQRFTDPIVKALRELGLDAQASGRNDIVVSGKKVSGTAQRLTKGRILHHGTLLFDSNPSMVQGALNVDPEKFRAKRAKSVKARIGNVRDFLKEIGKDMTLSEFWDYLKETLSGNGFETDSLSEEELAEVRNLAETKYRSWDWVYGRSPEYDVHSKRWWDAGMLEVYISVKKEHIENIKFYGDFLAVMPLSEVSEALKGCLYQKEEVRRVISEFPLKEMFGGISEDEILETMFPEN